MIIHDVPTGKTLDLFLHEDAVYGVSGHPATSAVFATACADGGLQRCVGYRYDEARNSVFFEDYSPPRGAEVYAVYVPID